MDLMGMSLKDGLSVCHAAPMTNLKLPGNTLSVPQEKKLPKNGRQDYGRKLPSLLNFRLACRLRRKTSYSQKQCMFFFIAAQHGVLLTVYLFRSEEA